MASVIPRSTATVDLPDDLLLQIGRLITIFSSVECSIREIVALLLRLTPQEARISVRTPRVRDSFEMITSLMDLHGLTVTHDMNALQSELSELEGARDWIAHGLWTQINGQLHLQITTGKWSPPGLKLPPGKTSIQRRIIPAAAPVMSAQIKEIADIGVGLIPVLADAQKQLAMRLAALPRIPL